MGKAINYAPPVFRDILNWKVKCSSSRCGFVTKYFLYPFLLLFRPPAWLSFLSFIASLCKLPALCKIKLNAGSCPSWSRFTIVKLYSLRILWVKFSFANVGSSLGFLLETGETSGRHFVGRRVSIQCGLFEFPFKVRSGGLVLVGPNINNFSLSWNMHF